jgi:hypothetical protein
VVGERDCDAMPMRGTWVCRPVREFVSATQRDADAGERDGTAPRGAEGRPRTSWPGPVQAAGPAGAGAGAGLVYARAGTAGLAVMTI